MIAAALCAGLGACAPAASDAQAQQAAAQECAQQYKPDTEPYNACVNQKIRVNAPYAEQMRRERSDEDDNARRAQDPQRDYMTR